MVALAVIPAQALLSRPQTLLKRLAVSLPDRPVLAIHESEDTMQLHNSELAIGGRLLDAAQAVPVAGQAWATVLVTLYAEEAVKLGVARANCLDRAVKSGSLLTVSPETVTRPIIILVLNFQKLASEAYRSRWPPGNTCRRYHQTKLKSCCHHR